MERKYKKFENTLWLMVKLVLYLSILFVFMEVIGQECFQA